MTDYAYSPISVPRLAHGDHVRATHAESGSVLIGTAVSVGYRSFFLQGPVANPPMGTLIDTNAGWTVERGTPVPPPLEPGLYVPRERMNALEDAVVYRVRTRGEAPVTIGLGSRHRGDLADLVRLCTVEPQADTPTSYDVLDGAPEGYYRDVDGDFWRIVDASLHFRRRSASAFRFWGPVADRGDAYAPYVPVPAEEARP